MEQKYEILTHEEISTYSEKADKLEKAIDELFDQVRDENLIQELEGRRQQAEMLRKSATDGIWHSDYASWIEDSQKRINELKKKMPGQTPQEKPVKKR